MMTMKQDIKKMNETIKKMVKINGIQYCLNATQNEINKRHQNTMNVNIFLNLCIIIILIFLLVIQ